MARDRSSDARRAPREAREVERRARIAASDHRTGVVLSVAGAIVAAACVGSLLIGGVILGAGDGREDAGFAEFAVTALPAILVLFAVVGLVLGEQLRRGGIRPNPSPRSTVLPSATNVSRFRMLSTGWHVLWILVGVALTTVLVVLPAASMVTGGWPHASPDGEGFTRWWIVYGSIGFGITCAAITSLVKKQVWLRTIRSDPRKRDGGAGRRFWRFVDYRWRADLWLSGVGGLLLAFGVTAIPRAIAGDPGNGAMFAALELGGAALVVLGIVACSQFWRCGEDLGGGESYA